MENLTSGILRHFYLWCSSLSRTNVRVSTNPCIPDIDCIVSYKSTYSQIADYIALHKGVYPLVLIVSLCIKLCIPMCGLSRLGQRKNGGQRGALFQELFFGYN